MPAPTGGNGERVLIVHVKEREMTTLNMLAKGLMLIAMTLIAFAVLAFSLGFEPAGGKEAAQCGANPAPACLFTIL